MRIAVITTGFAKDENDFAGAAALHNFVRGLAQTPGMDVTVFAMYYPFNRHEYKLFGAKIFSFASGIVNAKLEKMKIWKNLKKKFTDEHKRKNFDLVQALWLGESGYLASQVSKKHNIPMLAACCGGELAGIKSIGYGSQLKRWQKYFVMKTLERAKYIIAGSDFIIEKLDHIYGRKIFRKAMKIPFGVDERMFEFSNHALSAAAKVTLLSVANVLPVKAHENLFKAFKIVKEEFPVLTLTCCGRDEKSLLRDLALKYSLENNVLLKGEVEHKNIPETMKNSDIFVLSSLHESQNMSIIEASFCGLPVVSTDVGVAGEITPFLAEPGNYIQLAEQIISVISGYNDAAEKCRALFSKNRETFTLKNSTANFINLYKQVLAGPNK
jgi:glycosyltransferase involved in cell wall biosynthesis